MELPALVRDRSQDLHPLLLDEHLEHTVTDPLVVLDEHMNGGLDISHWRFTFSTGALHLPLHSRSQQPLLAAEAPDHGTHRHPRARGHLFQRQLRGALPELTDRRVEDALAGVVRGTGTRIHPIGTTSRFHVTYHDTKVSRRQQAPTAARFRPPILDTPEDRWFAAAMTTVAIFPPVLGVRQGTMDAAAELRSQGHEVHVLDYLDGLSYDEYGPAMTHAWEQLGQAELTRRAVEYVADLPDGFVAVGFSLGCLLAGYVATRREVSAVVMIAGAIPVSLLGERWPRGVPAQTHASLGDPWRDQVEIEQTVADIEAAGANLEVFDYPGSGHLFSDPSLPDEYDPESTRLLWSRVLPFVAARD